MTPTPARPRRDASADSGAPRTCACPYPYPIHEVETRLDGDEWVTTLRRRYCARCGGDVG